jgi:hypothetical protein
LGYALKIINHVIRCNEEVYGGAPLADGYNIVQKLKYLLVKIRNLQIEQADVNTQLA